MSQNTNYSVPLRQKAPPVKRASSGRQTRQTGRVEKSTSNPSSPKPTQLRRRTPLPANSIAASRDHVVPFTASGLAQDVHYTPPRTRGPQRRPMSWHPVAPDSTPWDAYQALWHQPQSSSLVNTAVRDDGNDPLGYNEQSERLPRVDWSSFSQSESLPPPVFPDPSNPGIFGSAGFDADSSLHAYRQPQSFYEMQHYSTPPSARLAVESFILPEEPSYPQYQPRAVAMPRHPAPSDCLESFVALPETTHLVSWNLPETFPTSKNVGVLSANNELVGMGLYDEPENMSTCDPQSDQYQSKLFGGGGKGWKLEETFHPKGEEIEAERDCTSSVGDGDQQSPLPDLDFEDFNPTMSDEIEPPLDFASSFEYTEDRSIFPWATEETQTGFVSNLNCYSGLHTFTQYPAM